MVEVVRVEEPPGAAPQLVTPMVTSSTTPEVHVHRTSGRVPMRRNTVIDSLLTAVIGPTRGPVSPPCPGTPETAHNREILHRQIALGARSGAPSRHRTPGTRASQQPPAPAARAPRRRGRC